MKITRAFSKKIQLNAYEPIEAFCSIELEVENDLIEKSRWADGVCKEEVAKSLDEVSLAKERKTTQPLFKAELKAKTLEENLLDDANYAAGGMEEKAEPYEGQLD